MLKWLLLLFLVGCSSAPRTRQERYLADPGAWEEAVRILLVDIRRREFMERFNDPSYFELDNGNETSDN